MEKLRSLHRAKKSWRKSLPLSKKHFDHVNQVGGCGKMTNGNGLKIAQSEKGLGTDSLRRHSGVQEVVPESFKRSGDSTPPDEKIPQAGGGIQKEAKVPSETRWRWLHVLRTFPLFKKESRTNLQIPFSPSRDNCPNCSRSGRMSMAFAPRVPYSNYWRMGGCTCP